MAQYTFPNQRTVVVHREKVDRDFLGIKNSNWQAAARDLSAHALKLYMYFAANADGFKLALSPADIQSTINMARSTYADQFRILVNKGYLVPQSGNTYEFFEVPQTRAVNNSVSSMTSTGYYEEINTSIGEGFPDVAKTCPSENIEINNIGNSINNNATNNSDLIEKLIPKVKEIVIPPPEVKAKKNLPPKRKPYEDFVF